MIDRKGVLILVPHEPTLDPRVHYTAQSLAEEHDVTVIATVQDFEARPEENWPRDALYETIRIPYRKAGALGACYAFFELWVAGRRGRAKTMPFLVAPTAFGLLIVTGILAAAILTVGAVFELAVLPWMLVSGQRPWIVWPAFRTMKKIGRGVLRSWYRLSGKFVRSQRTRPAVGEAMPRPDRLTSGRLENPTKGLRVTLSVLRFIFSTNALLLRHVSKRCGRPDVVYCHDLYSLQAGVMLKRAYSPKLVYDSHEYYPHQSQFWCYAPVITLYESILIRAIDEYITVSPQLSAELSRVYGVERVHVIPNVEPRQVPRSTRPETEMTTLADGRLRLLYQGNFAEGRGLEEVVSAWSEVDGTRVALFLRGPRNPWLTRLERMASDLDLLGKSVFVLPAVLEKDLIGAAQEADIGLIPYKGDWLSYRFACPNKLSQYLHAGLAILSSRIAFVEHIVTEGNVGLCYDVESRDSFVVAVHRLTENRRAVDEFRRNAVTYAEEEYNWERYRGVLLSLVDRV